MKKSQEELITDKKIVKSVRRYEGSELIWFGEWTSPDGYVHTGGSNRTAAYRQASSMLKERASFPEKLQKKRNSSALARNRKKKATSEPKGCLFVIVVALAIPVGIVVTITWIGEIFS